MTKNIAILVGIPEYRSSLQSLPACSNDLRAMETLLRGSRKFNDVFTLKFQDGEELKSELASLINRHKQDDITELFFYFTGHGKLIDDEFRYLLRDWDESRPSATSLGNVELDSMFRSLNPDLLIKVVDACYSGIPYVKDGTANFAFSKNELNSLKNCYFMSSSKSDERSWADEKISDFTKEFINAIIDSPAKPIRYKMIVDHITDSFQRDSKQTPMFVIQGDNTEIFDDIDQATKELLRTFVSAKPEEKTELVDMSATPTLVMSSPQSLSDKILSATSNYLRFDEFLGKVEQFYVALEKIELSHQFTNIFSSEKQFSTDFSNIPHEGDLGTWLLKNINAGYFAEPRYEVEEYEVDPPSSPFSRFNNLYGLKPQKVTRERKVLVGLRTDLKNLPFQTFSFILTPLTENMTRHQGWLTFVTSKRKISVFFIYGSYKEITWGEYNLEKISEWQNNESFLNAFDATATAERFCSSMSKWLAERITESAEVAIEKEDANFVIFQPDSA